MALSLGELVAYLRTDDTKLSAGLSAGQEKVKAFGEHAKKALAVAGAAAGAAVAAGIAQNLDIGAGRAKLAAQLDLSSEDSARIGAVAGKVYANNFGGSLDDVNEAIRAVGQNLGDVTKMSSAELQRVTQDALALSDTFGVDLAASTEAAGKLVKNGLAKNSQEAFDIMTTGFQSGIDRSGDFLDTINEYAPQFKKLGLSGSQMLGILQSGLKAGARDTDTIADAFKEFSLRSIDGSATTAAGFKAIGIDANTAASTIAKGGPAAAAMTQRVLSALRSIKDPVKQNAAGVALFGTQWEDTLRGVLPALGDVTQGVGDVTGSTQRMADTAGGSGKAKVETLKRSVEQWVQAQTNSSSAVGTTVAAVAAFGGPGLAMAGSLGSVVTALGAFNIGSTIAAAKSALVATGTKLWAAGQWLLNAAMDANPLGLIVLAIVALVAAIVYAWKNSETFRRIVLAAWDGIKKAASAVFGWLSTYVPQVFDKVKSVVMFVVNFIVGYIRFEINVIMAIVRGIVAVATFFRDGFMRGYHAVVAVVGAVIGYVRGIPGRIRSALGDLGGLLFNAGKAIIQGLINGLKAMANAPKQVMSSIVNGVKSLLPGSPVKEGPLRVLNRGYAGKTIVRMVADGMKSESANLSATVQTALSAGVGIPAPRRASTAAATLGSAAARTPSVLQLRGEREILALFRALIRDFYGGDVVLALGS